MPKHFMVRRCANKAKQKRESKTVVSPIDVKDTNGNETTKSGYFSTTSESSDSEWIPFTKSRNINHTKLAYRSDLSQAVCINFPDDDNAEDGNHHPGSKCRIEQAHNSHSMENKASITLSTSYNAIFGSSGQMDFSIPNSGQLNFSIPTSVQRSDFNLPSMATHSFGGFPDSISPKSAASVSELSPSFPISANIPKDKSPSSDGVMPKNQEKKVFKFDSEDILPFNSSSSLPKHLMVDNSPTMSLGRSTCVSVSSLSISNIYHIPDKVTTGIPATIGFPYIGLQAGVGFPVISVGSSTSPGFKSQAQTTILPKTKSPNHPPSKQKEKLEYVNGGFGIKNPLLTSSAIHEEPQYKKIKTYKCNICDEIFQKQSMLARHLKHHGNIKRYLCSFCVKGFDDKYDLKRHTRTHTGVKPFKCSDCSKSFTQRCSLEAHSRKVHANNLVYRFKERREKLHVCEDCGNITEDAGQHYEHLKLQHPNSPLLEKYYDRRQFKATNKVETSRHDSR